MLFSIGMDKRQFRSMLTFEALSYAFKGAFYGLLLALPLCYLCLLYTSPAADDETPAADERTPLDQ